MIKQNPFPETDPDRNYIWEMLIKRDIEAFIREDWSRVAEDFLAEGFIGMDGGNSINPDSWKFRFPNLESYKIDWLKQAREFKETELLASLVIFHFQFYLINIRLIRARGCLLMQRNIKLPDPILLY